MTHTLPKWVCFACLAVCAAFPASAQVYAPQASPVYAPQTSQIYAPQASTVYETKPPAVAAPPQTSPGAPAAPSATPPAHGAKLMHEAAQVLLNADTMSCKLREQINLRGRTLNGIGSYLQGPKQSRWIRLELKLQAGDQITTLQQVCDGHNLWIRRELFDHPSLEHVDVTKLLAQPGQAQAPLGALIAVGGLQGL